MFYTLLNAIRENFVLFFLSICTIFYYTIEPVERVLIDYNRFVVVNKVVC